ncbi:MAG: DUF1080 domain-containing protein, partial [Planctomycetaceae bacterium]|nr:DUF1080 domain-containing protein [Planctomycetaceae bacterium]
MQIIRLAAICFVVVWNSVAVAAEPIKVVIWDEQQPAQKKQYPNFLGNYIGKYLQSQEGLRVRAVSISDPKKGLSDEVLDNCDVLIWWGHVRNGDISEAEAKPVIDRLKAGKLSLLALHSAHWATPFVAAMQERAATDALAKLPEAERKTAKVQFLGEILRRPPRRDAPLTPSAIYEKQADGTTLIKITRPNCCFPAYKNHGEPSEMRTLSPDHPIAAGIPKTFTLAHTEMYDEAFHVPKPDEVVFEEHWKEGHHFRSGMVWNVGKGRVFYFRPGHETHAVFVEKLPMKIVENAVRWLGTKKQPLPELKVGKPISLFDGKTLDGWTKQDGSPVTDGWTVADGTIHQESRGGNIFYEQQVGDFELSFEWKIEKGGNNGLKYRVRKYDGRTLGCEYQLLGETGRSLNKGSCGSLYALYEPNEKKKLNPNGEWNTAKIVAHGPTIEHWMNGEQIVTADLASEEWRKRLSQSKFSPYKDFARNTQGRIMLTDHGSKVWYRNLALTPLPTTEIPPLAPVPPIVVVSLSDEQAEEFKLDPAFYKKCTVVEDVLIATSDHVSDDAIREAAYQFRTIMQSINPSIAGRIRERKVLCVLIGHDELTSDLPQFASDKTGKELAFYNWRQRGFLTHKNGRPTVVFAEEDVLEYEGGMRIESILIHEFGHVIHGAGFDRKLQDRLTETFQRARLKGIWMDGRAAQRYRRIKSETPVSLFDALVKSFSDQPPALLKACLDGGDILVNGKPT